MKSPEETGKLGIAVVQGSESIFLGLPRRDIYHSTDEMIEAQIAEGFSRLVAEAEERESLRQERLNAAETARDDVRRLLSKIEWKTIAA